MRLALITFCLLPLYSATLGNNLTATAAGTTSSIDTTGATLLTVTTMITAPGTDPSPTFTDSKGGTWSPLTEYASATPRTIKTYYQCIPTGDVTHVGTSHTLTIAANNNTFRVIFAAWTGVGGASGCFVAGTDTGGATGAGFSLTLGPVTPAAASNLALTCYAEDNASTSIASFGTPTYFGGSSGRACSWLSTPNTTALNPTWNSFTANNEAGNIAIFTTRSASSVSRRRTFNL